MKMFPSGFDHEEQVVVNKYFKRDGHRKVGQSVTPFLLTSGHAHETLVSVYIHKILIYILPFCPT